MSVVKEDVIDSSSSVQMCSGQEAGCEAVIHSMRELFEDQESEAVRLVDAANAFNNINRKALIRNIEVLCPIFGRYVKNCYKIPVRLFVIGGKEILSREGTTQGDPAGMAIYAIGITPLIDIMLEIIAAIRVAAFADDLSAVGKGERLKPWWDALAKVGPSFGYFPQPKKSWLIVKPQFEEKIREIFQGTEIQISVRGERHLGAVIGSNEYRKEYCTKIVKKWTNELKLLSEIALIHPKSAYACYVRGFQHRYNYCQRTIPGLEDFMLD